MTPAEWALYETAETRFLRNAGADDGAHLRQSRAVLPRADGARAIAEIRKWPHYAPTPLHSLEEIAARAKVQSVYYKDESGRFGLGSFKALGGAFAVSRLLAAHIRRATGKPPDGKTLAAGGYAAHVRNITVTSATDGNHGRSVAWGAKMFGCRCRIYIHAEVSEGRKRAIEAFGAKVVRIRGNYDESVRRAAADAQKNGWFVVSDTSYPGYAEMPRQVMAGYSVMAEEALRQIPVLPTHVFVQGGVGGLAAAVSAWLRHQFAAGKFGASPQLTVVEPSLAGCLHESARLRRAAAVQIAEETIMAGLSCGEVSELAWKILQPGARNFMLIDDALIPPLMRHLARRRTPVEGGESGVAGLAGFLAAACSPMRRRAGLTAKSAVLVFGTEGATDAEIYKKLTAGN